MATVIGALLLLAALLVPTAASARPVGLAAVPLPWWALAGLFGVTQVIVVHVQVRREAHSVSLAEVPLVLGLLLTSPLGLVAARVVGSLAVLGLYRRQAPVKLVFNTALMLANALTAVAALHAVLALAGRSPAAVWLAVTAAVAVSGAVDALATTLIVAIYDEELDPRDLLREPVLEAVRGNLVASLGMVAVHALTYDVVAVGPLVVVLGALLLGYRAYGRLSERHINLEWLRAFSEVVNTSPEVDDVLSSVLLQVKEILRAETARVVLAPAEGLDRRPDDLPGELWRRVAVERLPVLLPRGTRVPAERRLLDRLGHRDAVVVPLRGDADVVGALVVGDRVGSVRSFSAADVRLLETLANHASVALRNGRLIDRLRHEALHDALTGLPNRVYLQRAAAELLQSLEAGAVQAVTVGLMDLDGFKTINDTLGHQHGDELLKEVARRLVDAAGGAVVGRLGGDEFAFLLASQDASAQDGLRTAQRMLEALARPVELAGVEISVRASVGLALAPEHASDASTLLKRADLAMYAAKATDDAVSVYDPSLDHTSAARLALVGELRQALHDRDLIVHVQPKVHLKSGEVRGVEALVRWWHPVHGFVPPADFVQLAEDSGLVQELTHQVLDRALEACAQWRAEGRDLSVAVNLSARNLVDLGFVEVVTGLLARHAVPARLLTLEITEGSAMADPDRTIVLLEGLRLLGVRLSVDDFGTGYSSLAYLKRLPVQEVKIDKSFVTDVVGDVDDAIIVRAIVDLAANLGLDVVAEGVEDAAAVELLTGLGCDYAQGYHFGRPMSVKDLTAWLPEPPPVEEVASLPAQRLGA